MANDETVVVVNGHKLTAVKVGSRRHYFTCESFPDIPAKFEGCEDPLPCVEEFVRRATAAPATESKGEGQKQG